MFAYKEVNGQSVAAETVRNPKEGQLYKIVDCSCFEPSEHVGYIGKVTFAGEYDNPDGLYPPTDSKYYESINVEVVIPFKDSARVCKDPLLTFANIKNDSVGESVKASDLRQFLEASNK